MITLEFVDGLHRADIVFPDQPPSVGGSECLWKASLTKNGICGVAARNVDWNGEVPVRDWAVPNLVTALALANQTATRQAEQIAQGAVKLWRDSSGSRFGFAQRGDLQEYRRRVDARVVVRQKIKGHCSNLVQQLVECRRIGSSGDAIAMACPNRSFVVPGCGNSEYRGFDHGGIIGIIGNTIKPC